MSKLKRVRFKVPSGELTQVSAALKAHDISATTWFELLLTHLCCPSVQEYHELTRTYRPVLWLEEMRSIPGAAGEDLGDVSVFWKDSLILALAPALKLADSTLTEFLALVWLWSQKPDGKMSLPLAARLAAFGSFFSGDNLTWGGVYAGGIRGQAASPHELWIPKQYDVEHLPWNMNVRSSK